MFRAVVRGAFAYPRGGTAPALDAVEGVARPGGVVHLALSSRSIEVTIRGAGVVDCDIGRSTFPADITILVDGLEPSDIPPGMVVASSQVKPASSG